MKQFLYLFCILLASTASFAGKKEKSEESKSPENPKTLKRVFSMSGIRFKEEEKRKEKEKPLLSSNNSRDTVTRPRSSTKVEFSLNPDLIIEASDKKPANEDELPSIDDLLYHEKLECGASLVFKLGAIEKRQRMVREDPIRYGSINKEPAVHLINLGISTSKYPKIVRLSDEVQEEIDKLATEKANLNDFIFGFKRELKETKEKQAKLSIEKEIENSQERIKKIDAYFETKLKKDLSVSLTRDSAVAHIQSVVKVKRRIIEDFAKHDITITREHLRWVPPRDPHKEWKVRPFAEKPKLTLNMAREEREEHLKALKAKAIYGPAPLSAPEELGAKSEPKREEESEECERGE